MPDPTCHNWNQTITSWLKGTLDLGYVEGEQDTTQAFEMGAPENISSLITPAVAGFQTVAAFSGFSPTPYNNAYFNVPGALPLSSIFYNGHYGSYGGIIDTTRGGVLTKSAFDVSYDRDYFTDRELTGELRFNTSFDGRFNMSAGAVLDVVPQSRNQYWVVSNRLDFEASAIGGLGARVGRRRSRRRGRSVAAAADLRRRVSARRRPVALGLPRRHLRPHPGRAEADRRCPLQ